MRHYSTVIVIALTLFWVTFGLFVGLPCITDSTFGQRCAKAYQDPAQQEWCVIRLKKGGTVYRKPADMEHPDE